MKIIVFSDSHGTIDWMIAAMEEEKPDHIFFLGDHDRDGWDLSRIYPMIPIHVVRGNCDWGPGLEDLVMELGGIRFFLTHGHRYGVKGGLLRLEQAGYVAGADMVCFGHTHIPADINENGRVRMFNPGTVGGVRGGRGGRSG